MAFDLEDEAWEGQNGDSPLPILSPGFGADGGGAYVLPWEKSVPKKVTKFIGSHSEISTMRYKLIGLMKVKTAYQKTPLARWIKDIPDTEYHQGCWQCVERSTQYIPEVNEIWLADDAVVDDIIREVARHIIHKYQKRPASQLYTSWVQGQAELMVREHHRQLEIVRERGRNSGPPRPMH